MMSFIQNEKLLSMLRCKSKDQFDKFLDALDKTGQQYVRNHITGRQGQLVTSAKEVMVLPDLFVCLLVCLCVSKITQKVMDRSFWNFEGMSGMAKTTSVSILGVIRQESWILDHFEIFVTIALKGA